MYKLIKLEILRDEDRLCLLEESIVRKHGSRVLVKDIFYTVGRLPFLQGDDYVGDWIISLSMLYSIWRFDSFEEAQTAFNEILEAEHRNERIDSHFIGVKNPKILNFSAAFAAV